MNDLHIPNEVAQVMAAVEEHGKLRISALEQVILTKREEAITGRRMSGIEDTWMECEEAYLGIDDENRHEFMGSRWAKPTSMQGPVTTSDRRPNSSSKVRSTAFVRVSSRYVDAGTAKVCEISLPIDDKAFSFDPTPVPDLVKMADDKTQVVHPIHGPLERDLKPEEKTAMATAVGSSLPPGPDGQPSSPTTVPLTKADLAEEKLNMAKDAAKKAEKRIYDWMVESHYPGEMRKVIHDAARLGAGVLKGPFPQVRYDKAMSDGTLTIVEKIVPAYKWVDLWNIYPDPSCGEDIKKGSYLFELDYLSPRSVEELLDNPAYLPGRIAMVLRQGPQHKQVHNDRPMAKKEMRDDGRFETWYFSGRLTADDIEACIEAGATKLTKNEKGQHAIITMINDIIVRVTVNPLQSGRFNYHCMPWTRRAGFWAGVGVCEQIRMPQRMITAATRAMLVNAAKSAGSQIVLDRSCVTPADKNWEIYPDKLWFKNADATVDDVRKAFITFDFPNVQKEMMGIIEYGFKLCEETSNIPLISQGQSGKQTPETLGGQQLQDNNANQLLRAIGHVLDDTITEPVVDQSYEWLLLDDDVPDDEKGDFRINAHGSSAMVERYIQSLAMPNILAMSLNPQYGINPKLAAKESLRSQKLDPRNFTYTPEEQAKLDSQPPPPPPVVMAAQVRAQSAEKIAQGHDQVVLEKSKVDSDRDTAYNNSLAERDRIQADARREELMLERELALLKYANDQKISLDAVKAQLAKTAMIEQTRKELAAAELQVAQQQAMLDRTHDKIKHNETLRVDTTPSLVRDEVSTSLTP